MDIRLGDVLVMKKPHPCGNSRFEVLRVGMDIRLRCTGCSHEVMLPRKKVEKSIRSLIRDGEKLILSMSPQQPDTPKKPDDDNE